MGERGEEVTTPWCKQGCGRPRLDGYETCGGCTVAGKRDDSTPQIIDLFEALKKALEKKP